MDVVTNAGRQVNTVCTLKGFLFWSLQISK